MKKVADIPSIVLEKSSSEILGLSDSPLLFLIPKKLLEKLGFSGEINFELFQNNDSLMLVSKNESWWFCPQLYENQDKMPRMYHDKEGNSPLQGISQSIQFMVAF